MSEAVTPASDATPHASPDAPSIAEAREATQRRLLWPAVVASAALATLAYAPVDQGWVAWFAWAPMFWAVQRAVRPSGAFGLGYLFGIIHFAAITPWIGVTVRVWSGSAVGWVAWVLLAAVQGIWFGIFGILAWRLRILVAGDARLLAISAAWVVVEWARAQGSLAMPWGLLGYTQYRSTAIIQIAEGVGVYGVSLLVALVNAALASSLRRGARAPGTSPQERGNLLTVAGWRADVGVLVVPCLLYSGCLTYGLLCSGLRWSGRPTSLALVQPGSDAHGRDSAEQRIARLAGAAARLSETAPALVVWPESAVPGDAVNDPLTREAFLAFAGQTGGHHLVGTSYRDEMMREYNSAALFAPHVGLVGRYDKQQLVPFGEWTPARPLFSPVVGLFRMPDDLARGGPQDPLAAAEMRLGVMICYESVFPQIARDRVRRGANLLIALTNDGWAGRSASPRQHFAMTVFRAVETRRYVGMAALTGVTGIISPGGTYRAVAEGVPAIASDLVFLREGLSPYARWGDVLVLALALALAAVLFFRRPVESA